MPRHLENDITSSTDAQVWMEAFIERFPDTGVKNGTLLGWFANAIETGRQAGYKQAEAHEKRISK